MCFWVETTDGERVSVATLKETTAMRDMDILEEKYWPEILFQVVNDCHNEPYPANMLEL